MRKFQLFVATFVCIVNLSANSPQWSLNEVTEGWSDRSLVSMYFHNSEMQRQWAWELIGKHSFQGNEKILDFGCGDGKISAELCRIVQKGSVTGFDISQEMLSFTNIKFPTYAYPNLQFKKSQSLIFDDILQSQEYDVICSFCTFHLVADPKAILSNLKGHLKVGGKILLLIPAGKNPTFFQAANDIFSKFNLEAPWKSTPASGQTMRTLEGCTSLLTQTGFTIQSLEMIDTDNPFYSKEELISWMVGTTTANWNIPIELSSRFFTDLVNRMIEIDSNIIDNEGRIHFKLSRIHVIASY